MLSDATFEGATNKLAADLTRIFEGVEFAPDAIIDDVHSSGFAEDGSFMLMLTTRDGGMVVVSARAGERLRVHLEEG